MASIINAATSGGLITTADTSGILNIQTASTTAITVDASQNIGINVTPSVWNANFKALQISTGGSLSAAVSQSSLVDLGGNFYQDSGGTERYIASSSANKYRQYAGAHSWFNAPSGTAGNAITFTQAMTLDASGNLGIGTTSPLKPLDVTFAGTSGTRRFLVSYDDSVVTIKSANNSNNPEVLRIIGDNIRFSTGITGSGTEAARIDASGNLLVGTTTLNRLGSGATGQAFQLATSTGAEIYLSTSATASGEFVGAINFGTTGTASAVKRSALIASLLTATSSSVVSGNLVFYTNNAGTLAEAARIDSSGNLLVGTTSNTNLQNNNSFLTGVNLPGAGSACFNGTNGNTVLQVNQTLDDNAARGQIYFYRNESLIGSITSSNTTTAFNNLSDYRLKHDIQTMTGALAKVALLKPCTYKWNADGSAGEGFVAHELAEVCPHAVTGEKDAVDEEGNPQYQGIDTSFLVATLTAAIQEQQALITQLQADVAALKGA